METQFVACRTCIWGVHRSNHKATQPHCNWSLPQSLYINTIILHWSRSPIYLQCSHGRLGHETTDSISNDNITEPP